MKNMSTLYQHLLRSELVPPRVKTMAAAWQVWDSVQDDVGDTIHIDYDGEYGSERVLIVSGRATVVPHTHRAQPAASSQHAVCRIGNQHSRCSAQTRERMGQITVAEHVDMHSRSRASKARKYGRKNKNRIGTAPDLCNTKRGAIVLRAS